MEYHSDLTQSLGKKLSDTEVEWISKKWANGLQFIKNGMEVLDIGSSDGSFFDYLQKKNITGRFSCFDADKKAIIAARSKGYKGYDSLKSIKQKFDVITLWEVIEHLPIEKFISYLDFVKLHLKEDGILIVSTPNILNIFYPFWAEPTHIRPYCLESLCKILESQGFIVVHKKETHALRHPLKILACKLLGINMYAKVIVVCKIK